MMVRNEAPAFGGWKERHAELKAQEAVVTHSPEETKLRSNLIAFAGRMDELEAIRRIPAKRWDEYVQQYGEAESFGFGRSGSASPTPALPHQTKTGCEPSTGDRA